MADDYPPDSQLISPRPVLDTTDRFRVAFPVWRFLGFGSHMAGCTSRTPRKRGSSGNSGLYRAERCNPRPAATPV